MKKSIHIMLVEDHPAYRESITLALAKEPGIELKSQFGTAEQALRSLQAPNIKTPDLVLLDLNLPGMSGIEALPWIEDYAPDTKVIILTQSDQEADVLAAMSAGANGYLLKDTKRAMLRDAIHTVIDGGAMIDPAVAQYILNNLKTQSPKAALDVELSEREIKTLTLLSQGNSKKEIADQLCVTPHTVATFTKRIYEKLRVKNAPSAVNKGYQSGILKLDEDK